MAKKKFGISASVGKALNDTVKMAHGEQSNLFSTDILIEKIMLDPNNPRQHKIQREDLQNGPIKKDPDYNEKIKELEGLTQLSLSIQKDGLLNPITVVKEGDFFRVVAGERRFLASLIAKKAIIESRVFNREPNSFDLKVVQWTENEARKDLSLYNKLRNIIDIVKSYEDKKLETMSAKTLSKTVSIGLSLAHYYLAILNNKPLMRLIETNKITSIRNAIKVVGCKTESEMLEKLNGKEAKAKKQGKAQGAGRRRESISFGITKQTKVARVFVESILNQTDFKKYLDQFTTVDWSCMSESTKAFKKLVKIVEKEVG
jgi:ParB family transcriptional regulator, chromosome partitioning protein